MKRILLTALAALTLTALPLSVVRADQTAGEKVDSTARDAKASATSTAHKVQDKMCTKGDAACAAQKGKHAVQDTGTKAKNAAKDTKEKID